MSVRNKKKDFTKRDFVKTITSAYWALVNGYGYTRVPLVVESKLPNQALMGYTHTTKAGVIVYDYQKFVRHFKKDTAKVQQSYAGSMMAHEFRHFYQHKQIESNNPVESKNTLKKWATNFANYKDNGISHTEYQLQAVELDAFLFQYVFSIRNYGIAPGLGNRKVFYAMKKLYKRYCGEIDNKLFNKKIEKIYDKD